MHLVFKEDFPSCNFLPSDGVVEETKLSISDKEERPDVKLGRLWTCSEIGAAMRLIRLNEVRALEAVKFESSLIRRMIA